jgi:hypothetical protein
VTKRKATEDICSRPNKNVCSVVNSVPDAQDLQVNDIWYLKRIRTTPEISQCLHYQKSIDEVHEVLKSMKIVKNIIFLLINDRQEKNIHF